MNSENLKRAHVALALVNICSFSLFYVLAHSFVRSIYECVLFLSFIHLCLLLASSFHHFVPLHSIFLCTRFYSEIGKHAKYVLASNPNLYIIIWVWKIDWISNLISLSGVMNGKQQHTATPRRNRVAIFLSWILTTRWNWWQNGDNFRSFWAKKPIWITSTDTHARALIHKQIGENAQENNFVFDLLWIRAKMKKKKCKNSLWASNRNTKKDTKIIYCTHFMKLHNYMMWSKRWNW